MTQISMDKKYTTRSGLPVRILCVDRNNPKYPVVGSTSVFVGSWTEQGATVIGEVNDTDLVEVKEKKKAYLIVGVSPTKTLSSYDVAYSQSESETLRLLAKKEIPYIDWYIHEIEYEV